MMTDLTIESLLRIAEDGGCLPRDIAGFWVTRPNGTKERKYVSHCGSDPAEVKVSCQKSCLVVHGPHLIGGSVTAVAVDASTEPQRIRLQVTDTRPVPRYDIECSSKDEPISKEAETLALNTCFKLMKSTEAKNAEISRWRYFSRTPRRVRWDLVQELRTSRARQIAEQVITNGVREYGDWERWRQSAFGQPTKERTTRVLAMRQIAISLHDDIANDRYASPKRIGRVIARAIARNPKGREALPGRAWLDSLLERDNTYLEQHKGRPLVKRARRPKQLPF